MKIEIRNKNTNLIKVKDMPKGSIAKYSINNGAGNLYIILTHDNGQKYLKAWVDGNPVGLEMGNDEHVTPDWEVELLPAGTEFVLKF